MWWFNSLVGIIFTGLVTAFLLVVTVYIVITGAHWSAIVFMATTVLLGVVIVIFKITSRREQS